MVLQEQLNEFIQYITPEKKKELKEDFYKQKIQEAIDRKKTSFSWNELPEEVKEIIISFKQEIDRVYIPKVIKDYHLTFKSFKEFMFNEYRNEEEEGLSSLPAVNKATFDSWLWAMINKKSIINEVCTEETLRSIKFINCQKKYDKITKNKTPSLEDYITFRTKQKEEMSKKLKEKNKQKQKEEIKTDFKVGDLIYIENRLDGWERKSINTIREYYEAFIITGETKTQFRVDKIEWDDARRTMDNYWSSNWFGLKKNPKEWKRTKGKNIGKKHYIQSLKDTYRDSENPFDDTYYSVSKAWGGD